MNNMSNVSFEIESSLGTYKCYYKGNNMKHIIIKGSSEPLSAIITNLDEGKMYGISNEMKAIIVQKASITNKGLQYELARKH